MKHESHWILLTLFLQMGGCKKAPETKLPPVSTPSHVVTTPATISVEQRVKQILVNELGVDEKRVVPAARIMEDLEADSLDVVELIMRFEEEFQIKISDEDAKKVRTVGDASSYLKQRLHK